MIKRDTKIITIIVDYYEVMPKVEMLELQATITKNLRNQMVEAVNQGYEILKGTAFVNDKAACITYILCKVEVEDEQEKS